MQSSMTGARLPKPARTFGVDIQRSTEQLAPQEWDRLTSCVGLYSTHRFLTAVEEAAINNSVHWYIRLYRNDTLVATAVLSRFVAQLDLMLPRRLQKWCERVRRIWPRFLRLPILFCGIPVSIGKHTLGLPLSIAPASVIQLLVREMNEIAVSEHISLCCWKEYTGDDIQRTHMLRSYGYFRAHSLPRYELAIRWRTFGDYVGEMRHGYRRRIRQSLARLDLVERSTILIKAGDRIDDRPSLVVRPFTVDIALRLCELYCQVMRRASIKLELLNERFFVALAETMPDDLSTICLEEGGRVHGIALLGLNGATLNFLLVGFDYSTRDRYDTYFNLLHGIVAYAIDRQFKRIDLGQTTGTAKLRLGAAAQPVCFYLSSRSRFWHTALRLVNPLLFPACAMTHERVFRTD